MLTDVAHLGVDAVAQVSKMKQKDANKLNEEYQRLVRGLTESGAIRGANADAFMAGPGKTSSLTGCRDEEGVVPRPWLSFVQQLSGVCGSP